MQSRPSAILTNADNGTNQENQPTTIQHGLDEQPVPIPPLFSDESDGVELSSQSSSDAGGTSPLQHRSVAAVGELSPPQTPPPSSRNRISEYENATSVSSRKRTKGPAFEVLKKPRQPGDKRSPIADLPNEILTHALAHLSPTDLSAVASVSRRFHDLVTTPHAWRTAFSRYFPGPETVFSNIADDANSDDDQNIFRSERRDFTRLSALASWRSEYILRTRLLRSLARGKPVQTTASPSAARTGQSHTSTATTTLNSRLLTTVNALHATFGNGLNKRVPRFIHGANDSGGASSSDPASGKVDSWGLADPSMFVAFGDRYAGDAMYGLGIGEIVGVPNMMDVSQSHGMIYGEGLPDGMVYYRYSEEMRGRFLAASSGISVPDLGIPKVPSTRESVCSLWIAKSNSIPSLTSGLVGIMSGSSLGVLTSYSLGPLGARDQRVGRGEMTARWVLCPGVPVIAIAVDEQYSLKRQAQNRIWAVVLNALGEVFYLTKFPARNLSKPIPQFDDEVKERIAWASGRTVCWNIVEPSRRSARPDPYHDNVMEGSYSPRTSWNGMCLGKEQIKSETFEIEAFVQMKPRDFQRLCTGWDMRRRLAVDFAGDDGNTAGEAIVVVDCGLDDDTVASLRRFTRCKFFDSPDHIEPLATPPLTDGSTTTSNSASIFGGNVHVDQESTMMDLADLSESTDIGGADTPRPPSEEWRTSKLSLEGLRNVQITTSATDESAYATMTTSEDPLLSFSQAASVTSSPSLTPISPDATAASPADIPGQRARLLAVGTKLGSILLWNLRAPVSSSCEIESTIAPVRIIHTDSPQISCLALSALYLVHGGNDGLVQAWDPLASSTTPVRTLNSRYSSRARRRLIQAEASPQGVGINFYAAGAVCLDPDPTVLRGMVSLGTLLLYWSYSSSAADQYRSHKRRLRRSERGSNAATERATPVAQSNIKKFIANEQFELEQEEERRRRESSRLAGRFGVDLLGESATEEEMIAYAALLSEESLAKDLERDHSTSSMASHSTTQTPDSAVQPAPGTSADVIDADMAEAIRQSLALSDTQGSSEADGQDAFSEFRVRKAKPRKPSPSKRSASPALAAESSNKKELTDLEFALQLSLAEEQSRIEAGVANGLDFPDLAPSVTQIRTSDSKGKGRAD